MKKFLGLTAVVAASFAIGSGLALTAHAGNKDHKVAICHGTASKTNPYVLIVVDQSAVAGHFNGTAPGHGKNNFPDFYANNGSCSTPPSGENPNS